MSIMPLLMSPMTMRPTSSMPSPLIEIALVAGYMMPTRNPTRATAPKERHTARGSSAMRRPATIIWGVRAMEAMSRPMRLIDHTPTRLMMRKIAPMKPMNTAMPMAVPRFIARAPTVSHTTRRTRPMIGPTALTRSARSRRATPRGVMATLRMASHEDREAKRIMARPSARRAMTPTHISPTPIGRPWKDRAPHAGRVTA